MYIWRQCDCLFEEKNNVKFALTSNTKQVQLNFLSRKPNWVPAEEHKTPNIAPKVTHRPPTGYRYIYIQMVACWAGHCYIARLQKGPDLYLWVVSWLDRRAGKRNIPILTESTTGSLTLQKCNTIPTISNTKITGGNCHEALWFLHKGNFL